jgi:hypothetical protein
MHGIGEGDHDRRPAGFVDHGLEVIGAGLHVERAGAGGLAHAAVVEADDTVINDELGLERVVHGRVGVGVRSQDHERAGPALLPVDLHAPRTLQIHGGILGEEPSGSETGWCRAVGGLKQG